MELKEFNGIEKHELAPVHVAKAILDKNHEVMNFNDLLHQVADYLELDDEQLEEQIAQFYTDLNIDGRFISLGENRWGLRGWYPVDSIDEELTHDNDLEDITPKQAPDGFDDIDDVEDELSEDEADEEEIELDDNENYDEYRDELDDDFITDDEGSELEDLSIVDDEDVLGED